MGATKLQSPSAFSMSAEITASLSLRRLVSSLLLLDVRHSPSLSASPSPSSPSVAVELRFEDFRLLKFCYSYVGGGSGETRGAEVPPVIAGVNAGISLSFSPGYCCNLCPGVVRDLEAIRMLDGLDERKDCTRSPKLGFDEDPRPPRRRRARRRTAPLGRCTRRAHGSPRATCL